jgi:two-component system, chemotaxis family, chemotaxis protein CheY
MSKALIVDDSKTIRMVLGKIMRELGYETCEAANGQDALKVMETEKNAIHLVLADWNMPVMNGLDMVRHLRQNPELDALKVIMVTTETEIDHMVSALEAGANEYRKPRMTTGFQVEFLVGAARFHGFCKDVSSTGIRAEFEDDLVENISGLLILRPRSGVLEVRSRVAYVEKCQVGLLFLFETPWEQRMTVDFIAGVLEDKGLPPLTAMP